MSVVDHSATAPAQAPETEPVWSFRAVWTLGALLLIYVLAMVDRLILTMLVPSIQSDLGVTDFQVSLVLGPAFAFSHSLAVYPLGWAVDRFNRTRLLAGSVAFWSMATVACAFARSFPGLIMSRIGVAVGEATLLPAAYSIIADRFPRRRLTFALAVFGMGPKIGTAAAFAIGAGALALADSVGGISLPIFGPVKAWQFVLILVGGAGFFMSLLALSIIEPERRKSLLRSGEKKSDALVLPFLRLHWKLFVPLLAGFSLMGICSGALANWVPTYLTREFGWSAVEYGPVMAIISLAAASSILVKGFAVDWLFARGVRDAHLRLYTWLQCIAAPALIGAFVLDSPFFFLCLFGVVNVVALSYLLYASAIIQLIAPNELRGRLSAVVLFCSSVLAQGVAPSLVAVLTQFVFKDQQELGASLFIVSLTALILSLVAFRIAMPKLRQLMKELECQS